MDVGDWLRSFGLGEYEPLFLENKIDVEVLPDLTDSDLSQFGVPFGHRKRLLKATAAIRALADEFGLEAGMHEGLVTFSVESGEHFVPQLFSRLPVAIRSVSVSRPSLDDVFMSYTGKTIRDAEASVVDRNRMLASRFGRR